jgi:uncharacterized membrane protein
MKREHQLVFILCAIVIVLLIVVTANQSQTIKELSNNLHSPQILKSSSINIHNSTSIVNSGTIINGDNNVVSKEIDRSEMGNVSNNVS